MDFLVTSVVGVGSRMDKGVVELCLADVGAETVDLLESLVGVEAKRVGTEANNGAWI